VVTIRGLLVDLFSVFWPLLPNGRKASEPGDFVYYFMQKHQRVASLGVDRPLFTGFRKN
jgi:hypothetical protein